MRKVTIEIDCNEKTCGMCPWEEPSADGKKSDCGLFFDEEGDRIQLRIDKDRNTVRCEECLEAEGKIRL